jgi:hypothetical protein
VIRTDGPYTLKRLARDSCKRRIFINLACWSPVRRDNASGRRHVYQYFRLQQVQETEWESVSSRVSRIPGMALGGPDPSFSGNPVFPFIQLNVQTESVNMLWFTPAVLSSDTLSSRNLRFGRLECGSYYLPNLDATNLPICQLGSKSGVLAAIRETASLGVYSTAYGSQTQSNCFKSNFRHSFGSNHSSLYLPEFARTFSTNIRMAMYMLPSDEIAIELGYCCTVHLGK